MSIRQARSGTKMKDIKTFTYFIPAPPHRKTGYREKEFDKIMQGFIQSGFELLDMKVQAVETGLFVVALLKASSKKVASLDQDLDLHESFKLQDQHSSPDIILEDEDA